MGFSLLLRFASFIPKWLLMTLAVGFWAYFMGIDDGRAPYRLAEKTFVARAEIIIEHTDRIRDIIEQKGQDANEIFAQYECIVSDADARKLSDIVGQ